VAFTAYGRGYRVGKRYPSHQRVFLVWTAVVAVIVLALTWYKPLHGLFLLILPMTTSLLFTAWVTFDHHAGLDADDPFHASYNIIHPLFNRLTGNLGYHTAHHYKQALHWSKLPELHAEIAPSIPRELFRQSTFFKGAHVPPPPNEVPG
jgi:fatty acid desaturase